MLVSPLGKLSLKSFSHFFIGHTSKSVNVNLIFIEHAGAVMATYTIVVNMVYSAFTVAEMELTSYISKNVLIKCFTVFFPNDKKYLIW